MCALACLVAVVVLNEIFLVVPDGRVPLYELLRWRTSPRAVCATQPRIATHAHAMPPATQPAVTQASPILFGCRMHAGQVLSDEEHRDGGLRAGRVAYGRPICLYLAEASRVEYLSTQKKKHMLRTAHLISLRWNALLEHARDRAGSSRAGPILEHGEDSQHV